MRMLFIILFCLGFISVKAQVMPGVVASSIQQSSPSPLLTGLAAYYKLDESSGNALDAVGAHNGTVTSATQNVTGKINTCYTFNGSSSNINIGTVSTSSVFTYAAWIKTSSATYQCIIAGKGIGSGSTYFRVNNTGNLGLANADNVFIGGSAANVNTGSWIYVAVTYNSSGTYVFYVNGTASGSGTNLQTFSFGNYSIGLQGNEYFNGQIDEVGIWNRVLTSTEITTLYNSGMGKSYPFQ